MSFLERPYLEGAYLNEKKTFFFLISPRPKFKKNKIIKL
jgi:hypothetical protein